MGILGIVLAILLVLLVVVISVLLWGIVVNNNLVVLKERVRNSMSQIAVQVESRWDALRNLIGATKAYSSHEAETLQSVIFARSGKVNKDSTVDEVERDEDLFQQALVNVQVLTEQYPELKAATLYKETMIAIRELEDNVKYSRQVYNDTVTKYNTAIKVFPSSIVANLRNFTEDDYFKGTEIKAQNLPTWE